MKVVLARPWNKTSMLIPNHGLGYLATALKRRGDESLIIDCIRERLRPNAFLKRIEAEKPDVIGFQVYTFDLPVLESYIDALRSYNGIIVAGGPHPTAAPFDMQQEISGNSSLPEG